MNIFRKLFANDLSPGFIAGTCVMESRSFALETAEELKGIFKTLGLLFRHKSSFDKANRSSLISYRGVGMKEGLFIFAEVKEKMGVFVLTDVHEARRLILCQSGGCFSNPCISLPSNRFYHYCCSGRQAGQHKKGRFLASWDMKNVIKKACPAAHEAGLPDDPFTVCERGTFFGYGNLLVDMRGLPIMAETTGCPVIFDATHSVQFSGAQGTSSGGQREYIPHLTRAAVATGAVSQISMEAHSNSDKVPCHGPKMLPSKDLPKLLNELKGIHAALNGA